MEQEKFYTAVFPPVLSFRQAVNSLIYAIKETVYCDRTLLIPWLELDKEENFNTPSQVSAVEYFDLSRTIVTRGGQTVSWSWVEHGEWPDMNHWTVANIKPDQALDTGCSKRLIVRYPPSHCRFFPQVYQHSFKTDFQASWWCHDDYKDIRVQLEPAPLWRDMAVQTIESLNGNGQHLVFVQKSALDNGKDILLTPLRKLFQPLNTALKEISTAYKCHQALKPVQKTVSPGTSFYIIYNRSYPSARWLRYLINRSLFRHYQVFSYHDFPDLRNLVATKNLLFLDNFALMLIERLIEQSARKKISF